MIGSEYFCHLSAVRKSTLICNLCTRKRGLYQKSDCKKAILTLKDKGVQNVIITLEEKGCAYYENGEVIFHPAQKANAVDTTAARDSFIGALTNMLAEGASLKDSIAYAAKVSAITVSRRGAADSIPYAKEVDMLQ